MPDVNSCEQPLLKRGEGVTFSSLFSPRTIICGFYMCSFLQTVKVVGTDTGQIAVAQAGVPELGD